ncbi:hypothetical protein JR316_0009346 [Psilocybe cubensis]|uniref:Uncharacterized protein n=1 Tax=Psilocybe cubensis TaxID=181762 RepID=A0ACB8GTH0_PSICU|nr:hypothetical protein JR316_0009346 [Psilocybe cubensis]KAH9478884.1 hypothetical protein JR316_0009346 [Psilocybe cubensis]
MASYDWRMRHAGLIWRRDWQDCFHRQLFAVLIPALKDPEPQVYVHTVLALINFCKGVERDTFLLYLEPIVEQLLKLLNPSSDQTQVRWYVQEQAITTLAMVADASEVTCGKVHPLFGKKLCYQYSLTKEVT